MKVLKTVLITLSLLFCHTSSVSAQSPSVSGGQKCAKSQIGQTVDSGGSTFLCKKSGKKQFWRWQTNIDLCDKSENSSLTGCTASQIYEWQNVYANRALEAAKVYNQIALNNLETRCYSLFSNQDFTINDLMSRFASKYLDVPSTAKSEVKTRDICAGDSNVRAQLLPVIQESWTGFANIYNQFDAALNKGNSAIKSNRIAVLTKTGNCLWNPSDPESQLLINGKTYNGLGGSLLLCKNGVIVDQGKKPFTAAYLTCTVFNSKSDNGCWVKDSWGYLTWLFNLPMKTPEGQPVSTGSYYTINGYCQVALYKNFAWTDSCR